MEYFGKREKTNIIGLNLLGRKEETNDWCFVEICSCMVSRRKIKNIKKKKKKRRKISQMSAPV